VGRLLGRIARAEGDRAGAHQHLRDARAAFAEVPAPFEVARTDLDLAELSRSTGDPATAARHAGDALKTFAELRAPRYVERAEDLVRALSAGRAVRA
jgi:hypothetical protein